MPRNTLSINAAWFSRPNIVAFDFLTMVFGAPIGTLYWTNYPCESLTIDINDGSTEQTWDGTKVFTLGQFEQGEQSALAVSDIEFGNSNYSFSNIMKQYPYGVRGVQVGVSFAAFTEAEPHTFIDSMRGYGGVMDRAEVTHDSVRVSILPYRAPLTAKFPKRRFSTANGFFWIPKPNLKVEFGIAGQVALPTQPRPVTPPVGGPNAPPPGNIGPSARGRATPVRVEPRGAPPTANRGRRTRTVTR